MKDSEDIKNDLVPLTHGDPEIKKALDYLYHLHKQKGLPYRELCVSRLFGRVKYLLLSLNDPHGTVLITDLDTDETLRLVDHNEKDATNKKEISSWRNIKARIS